MFRSTQFPREHTHTPVDRQDSNPAGNRDRGVYPDPQRHGGLVSPSAVRAGQLRRALLPPEPRSEPYLRLSAKNEKRVRFAYKIEHCEILTLRTYPISTSVPNPTYVHGRTSMSANASVHARSSAWRCVSLLECHGPNQNKARTLGSLVFGEHKETSTFCI